jgi:uncharacterized protein (TIGR02453 family)
MATVASGFQGFSRELIDFLRDLGSNNTREWFQAHYDAYQAYFVEPAREFVLAMGECLPQLGADVHAEPKVRGSIFAINRDVRFSKDKTPYKTHLDLWFWQGRGPSRERPAYYVRLTPQRLTLGAGMHAFSDTALARYRSAVLDDTQGQRLEAAALAIQTDVQGRRYKKVPAGLPAQHARADWLRHSGLFADVEQPLPPQVFSAELTEVCFAHFQRLQPLQQWLVEQLPD